MQRSQYSGQATV